jgi:hypothetical protein
MLNRPPQISPRTPLRVPATDSKDPDPELEPEGDPEGEDLYEEDLGDEGEPNEQPNPYNST